MAIDTQTGKTHILKENEYSGDFNKNESEWKRIKCECGNDSFHVIYTDHYETTVKCMKCGFMDIVHEG